MASTKTASQKRGTRKTFLKQSAARRKRNASRNAVVFIWVRRIGLVLAVCVVVLWGVIGFMMGDVDTRMMTWAQGRFLAITADAGFQVNNILVDGRQYSNPTDLMTAINVSKGMPLFAFDPIKMKADIEAMGWVKSARVERRLPDTVYIKLKERTPMALWQDKDKSLFLVDTEGQILMQENLIAFKDLMMIRGEGAPEKAEYFLSQLSAESDLKLKVDHAELVDGRRWNLYLSDGKRIKLPENDVDQALHHLMSVQAQDDILGNNTITDIDVRYTGRLIIRTQLGKVQDYKMDKTNAGARL